MCLVFSVRAASINGEFSFSQQVRQQESDTNLFIDLLGFLRRAMGDERQVRNNRDLTSSVHIKMLTEKGWNLFVVSD